MQLLSFAHAAYKFLHICEISLFLSLLGVFYKLLHCLCGCSMVIYTLKISQLDSIVVMIFIFFCIWCQLNKVHWVPYCSYRGLYASSHLCSERFNELILSYISIFCLWIWWPNNKVKLFTKIYLSCGFGDQSTKLICFWFWMNVRQHLTAWWRPMASLHLISGGRPGLPSLHSKSSPTSWRNQPGSAYLMMSRKLLRTRPKISTSC